MLRESFAGAALLILVDAASPGVAAYAEESSGGTGLVGVERFLATPRAGVRIVGAAFYTRKEGFEMCSRHAHQSKSDTADVAFVRYSSDNGTTWSDPKTVATNSKTERGTLRRYVMPGFVDPETGVLLTMILQGILPHDKPMEGMKHWTLRYALSTDGGRTSDHAAPVVHVGEEYSPGHPLPGVWVGKNSAMIGDQTCVPIRTRKGAILQPVQITPIGPDGVYFNPGGGYTYHDSAVLIGHWNEERTLDWELSELVKGDPKRSTRGMIEPTVAEFPDGRILMVLRGSNDAKPQLPGHRWYAVSKDHGRTWTQSRPWTYSNGESFFSPSSCSRLLSHSGGKIYWIGNISPGNSRGNHPRYPLVIGEVDRDSLLLKKATIRTVDDRRPVDPPHLQLSNFYAYEDRKTREVVIHCSPLGRQHELSPRAVEPGTNRSGLDWTGDAFRYRIEVR